MTALTTQASVLAPRAMQVIRDVAPRLPELGRIRLGAEKTDPRKPGHPLLTFRVTSPDVAALEAVQKLYGGQIAPWESPNGQEFQMVSEANILNVAIPPDETAACSSFYEVWGASGCLVRCDGVQALVNVPPVYKRDPKTRKVLGVEREGYSEERACSCDPSNRECARVLRLNVVLTDVDVFGVWRLETGSFYAAQEIPGVVRLAATFAQHGMPVPATLRIAERTTRSVVRGKRTFAVPVLRLAIPVTTQMLLGGGVQPSAPALPAAPDAPEASEQPVIDDAEPLTVETPVDEEGPFAGMEVATTPGGQRADAVTGEIVDGDVDEQGWPRDREAAPADAPVASGKPWGDLTFGQLQGAALAAFNAEMKRLGQAVGAFQREWQLTSLKDVPAAEIIAWAGGGM